MEIAVEPVGGDAHMHELLERCLDIIEESGLHYHVGPMGTVVQGLPDQLYELAAKVHRAAVASDTAPRILVSLRVDDNRLGEHSLDDRVRILQRE